MLSLLSLLSLLRLDEGNCDMPCPGCDWPSLIAFTPPPPLPHPPRDKSLPAGPKTEASAAESQAWTASALTGPLVAEIVRISARRIRLDVEM